ncbi:hypothetical protein WJX72_004216 [[Myrmecia] bisecta]|uniref:HNH nuclease domain-containing protein n=1 Tax=[Myrmecia] bisecta TaxID=41462 RepID=A0AAW1R5Y9_9CHLO
MSAGGASASHLPPRHCTSLLRPKAPIQLPGRLAANESPTWPFPGVTAACQAAAAPPRTFKVQHSRAAAALACRQHEEVLFRHTLDIIVCQSQLEPGWRSPDARQDSTDDTLPRAWSPGPSSSPSSSGGCGWIGFGGGGGRRPSLGPAASGVTAASSPPLSWLARARQRMAYPQNWDAAEVKLKELYPNDLERGKVRKKLLDLDETKALKYFRDSQAAVKATLDELLNEGSSDVATLRKEVQELRSTVDSALPLVKVVALLIDWTEDQASASSVADFKDELVSRYSKKRHCSDGPLIYCMLTHEYLPRNVVIASHLWKRAWWKYMEVVGLEDINDSRNGLLLAKPIEWAFDSSQLCFIYDKDYNHYTALLLNRALAPIRLADKLEELLQGRGIDPCIFARVHQTYGNRTFGWHGETPFS